LLRLLTIPRKDLIAAYNYFAAKKQYRLYTALFQVDGNFCFWQETRPCVVK
jgi:hypothetical protein